MLEARVKGIHWFQSMILVKFQLFMQVTSPMKNYLLVDEEKNAKWDRLKTNEVHVGRHAWSSASREQNKILWESNTFWMQFSALQIGTNHLFAGRCLTYHLMVSDLSACHQCPQTWTGSSSSTSSGCSCAQFRKLLQIFHIHEHAARIVHLSLHCKIQRFQSYLSFCGWQCQICECYVGGGRVDSITFQSKSAPF